MNEKNKNDKNNKNTHSFANYNNNDLRYNNSDQQNRYNRFKNANNYDRSENSKYKEEYYDRNESRTIGFVNNKHANINTQYIGTYNNQNKNLYHSNFNMHTHVKRSDNPGYEVYDDHNTKYDTNSNREDQQHKFFGHNNQVYSGNKSYGTNQDNFTRRNKAYSQTYGTHYNKKHSQNYSTVHNNQVYSENKSYDTNYSTIYNKAYSQNNSYDKSKNYGTGYNKEHSQNYSTGYNKAYSKNNNKEQNYSTSHRKSITHDQYQEINNSHGYTGNMRMQQQTHNDVRYINKYNNGYNEKKDVFKRRECNIVNEQEAYNKSTYYDTPSDIVHDVNKKASVHIDTKLLREITNEKHNKDQSIIHENTQISRYFEQESNFYNTSTNKVDYERHMLFMEREKLKKAFVNQRNNFYSKLKIDNEKEESANDTDRIAAQQYSGITERVENDIASQVVPHTASQDIAHTANQIVPHTASQDIVPHTASQIVPHTASQVIAHTASQDIVHILNKNTGDIAGESINNATGDSNKNTERESASVGSYVDNAALLDKIDEVNVKEHNKNHVKRKVYYKKCTFKDLQKLEKQMKNMENEFTKTNNLQAFEKKVKRKINEIEKFDALVFPFLIEFINKKIKTIRIGFKNGNETCSTESNNKKTAAKSYENFVHKHLFTDFVHYNYFEEYLNEMNVINDKNAIANILNVSKTNNIKNEAQKIEKINESFLEYEILNEIEEVNENEWKISEIIAFENELKNGKKDFYNLQNKINKNIKEIVLHYYRNKKVKIVKRKVGRISDDEMKRIIEKYWTEKEIKKFINCIPCFGKGWKLYLNAFKNKSEKDLKLLYRFVCKYRNFVSKRQNNEKSEIVDNCLKNFKINERQLFAIYFPFIGKNWNEMAQYINKNSNELRMYYKFYYKNLSENEKKFETSLKELNNETLTCPNSPKRKIDEKNACGIIFRKEKM